MRKKKSTLIKKEVIVFTFSLKLPIPPKKKKKDI